jgi:hypothetical protein
MCLPVTSQSRRVRTLLCIGMFCLALSLGSRSMNLTCGLSPNPLDFLRGLLMGISIAVNLFASMLSARLRRDGHA